MSSRPPTDDQPGPQMIRVPSTSDVGWDERGAAGVTRDWLYPDRLGRQIARGEPRMEQGFRGLWGRWLQTRASGDAVGGA